MPTVSATYRSELEVNKLPMQAGTYTLSLQGDGRLAYGVDTEITSFDEGTELTADIEITVSEYITFVSTRGFNKLTISTTNTEVVFGPVLSQEERTQEQIDRNSTSVENIATGEGMEIPSFNGNDFQIKVLDDGTLIALDRNGVIVGDPLFLNRLYDRRFIDDADEENIADGWSYTNSIPLFDNENLIQSFTATAQNGQIFTLLLSDDQVISTGKEIFGVWLKTDATAYRLSVKVEHDGGNAFINEDFTQSTRGYEFKSIEVDLSTYVNGKVTAVYIVNRETSAWNEIMVENKVTIVNLTDTYGAGNEITKSQFDVIMNNANVLYAVYPVSYISKTKPSDVDLLLEDYTLTFEDQFVGKSLDFSKWNYKELGPRKEAINREDAIVVADGNMTIKTFVDGDDIITGMIATQDLFEQQEGYFECRAKLQKTNGCWSAFWIQSPTIGDVIDDFVASGVEIDVMEYFDAARSRVQTALHWNGYDVNEEMDSFQTDYNDDFDLQNEFHTYGVEWTSTYYKFYIDGFYVGEFTYPISGRTQYMILSCEVGFNQKQVIDATPNFQDEFIVDYVKVYQKNS